MLPKTCVYAGLWLVGDFFFSFQLLLYLPILLQLSLCLLFQSVCTGVGCCQQVRGEEKKVQKPLHTSVCQIFANTSSPAGLAAKVIPVMAGVAAASPPDAVAGAAWQDINVQFDMPAPEGLRLKLSNEKQCVLNCPHSDSQLLWECGFWIMSKVWGVFGGFCFFFLFFFSFFLWWGEHHMKRHWRVK